MKRYLVFAFDQYYPCGGWSDFKGDFDYHGDALALANRLKRDNDYVSVVDTGVSPPDVAYIGD